MRSSGYGAAILVMIVIAALFFLRSPTSISEENTNLAPSGEAQVITLSLKNYNYYPNTITVDVGKPVRIYLDSSVGGCLRDFTVREFGIHKYLKTPEDYVEFTPTKPGTYRFACSMGMGTGTIVAK